MYITSDVSTPSFTSEGVFPPKETLAAAIEQLEAFAARNGFAVHGDIEDGAYDALLAKGATGKLYVIEKE